MPKASSRDMRRVVVYLPIPLAAALKRACARDGQSVSAWARIVAEQKTREKR